MHQLHARPGGKRRAEISGQRLAGGQRHRTLKVQDRPAGHSLPVLVDPAQMVAQQVVKEPLSDVKDLPKLLRHRVLVLRVVRDQSSFVIS